MIGIKIKEIIFLDIDKVDFNCPYCGKKYSDNDDKYLNRLNKNKSGITSIKCTCKKTFSMTYNYRGEAVSFK
jgi:transposase-like protein